ncbi:hypothetical protein [Thalassomonas sp. M1454]|uniref:hypothetical protein n=1 Tax=Thalassomonas sp. M1454 TaxID=2594477 RepID=UPI00117D7ED5|nr:hypothetical protein [Thalassomonas sp. M1454]TRX57166.1 hypothetical protein FNN08_06620 [Thalassomonas sp. M1454]
MFYFKLKNYQRSKVKKQAVIGWIIIMLSIFIPGGVDAYLGQVNAIPFKVMAPFIAIGFLLFMASVLNYILGKPELLTPNINIDAVGIYQQNMATLTRLKSLHRKTFALIILGEIILVLLFSNGEYFVLLPILFVTVFITIIANHLLNNRYARCTACNELPLTSSGQHQNVIFNLTVCPNCNSELV